MRVIVTWVSQAMGRVSPCHAMDLCNCRILLYYHQQNWDILTSRLEVRCSVLCLCLQARGIDVQQVSLVINYDLPTNRENYIHRWVEFLNFNSEVPSESSHLQTSLAFLHYITCVYVRARIVWWGWEGQSFLVSQWNKTVGKLKFIQFLIIIKDC